LMKAIGRNIIIEKIKEGTTTTKGGLLLAENQREDIRYVEATVLSVGEQVEGLKEKDSIFFDRHAGHKIEIDKQTYHVIKNQDVVVVL
jgi:chaperonin GroES